MRKYLTTAMAIALMSGVSYADLQNVEIGGELRMRGNSYFDIAGFDGDHSQYTEQRTAIAITADFTDQVSANITFSNYKIWGDTWNQFDEGTQFFDSNEGPRGNSISLNEAYITLGDAVAGFDLKIGRQEIELGSEFLIGNENTASGFTHRAFDGIRADYAGENFNVTLMNLKAWEEDYDSSEKDQDEDLHIIYATYTGFENHTIDAYAMNLRAGFENEDNVDLLTIGARAAGTFGGGFDYELELAHQSGDTGDSDVDFEGIAVNSELGYTFDSNMQPRVFLGAAYIGGWDVKDDGLDVGFQRLYSDWEYSEFLGDGDMTNVLILRAGVSANVTEKIGLALVVSTFELIEEEIASLYIPVNGTDDDIGTEIGLYMTYQYSEDVAIEVGAAQLLVGDAVEGWFDDEGEKEENPTYVYAEINLTF